MELFIIRHGQSQNNALEGANERVEDPALTPVGEQQAECVAAYLAEGQHLFPAERGNGRPLLDHLYTSAMLRTMHTAQPIGKALGMAPEVWIDVHEWGGIYLEHDDERGIVGYPGMGRSAIEARFSGYILPEGIGEQGWWDPQKGQEQVHAAHGRAIGVANALCARAAEDCRIGMVSHGGFIGSLLKALFHLLPSGHVGLDHQNTAITRLAFVADGGLSMDYMNRTEHLTDELLT